ncbi:MAG: RNA polymerase sigma factor [Pseudomonadota bacterium]
MANHDGPVNAKVSLFCEDREQLLALARSIVKNGAIAEEIVQDSWIRWDGHSFEKDSSRWILRRIVSNLCKDWLRRQKVERSSLQVFSLFEEHAPDTERVVISRQELRIVVNALKRLPKRTLTAFRLNRLDGLTFVEIGAEMNISAPRAYQLVCEALLHLTIELDR